MKISNNALNFLLAQYRAIFKRAYVKGIASAVLLTAGLAAGQAQAATVTDIADINSVSGEETLIFGDKNGDQLALKLNANSKLEKNLEINTSDATIDQYINISEKATAGSQFTLDGNGKDITINGDATKDTHSFIFGSQQASSKIIVNKLNKLTIDGAKVNLETPASGSNSAGNQAGVDIGAKQGSRILI